MSMQPPPPPPPGGYGAPPPPPPPPPPPGGYPGSPTPAGPQNGSGTAALILGILGVTVCCATVVVPIIAIILGRQGVQKADAGLATNRGMAQAGFVLGIIGLVVGLLWVVFWIIGLATGNATWSFNIG